MSPSPTKTRALCSFAGSPLNKVLGLGLGSTVEDADLDAIEAFYDERGIPVQIELCPLAAPGLSARLTKRGYQLQAFENQLAREIGTDRWPEPGPRVTLSTPEQDDLWLHVAVSGFAAADSSGATVAAPPADMLENIRKVTSGFIHPDFERLLVWVDGQAAGVANASALESTRH